MEKLSSTELADYKEVFSMFDKDGDGTIDNAELGSVMASLGVNPSELELQEMIAEIDTDQNGTIDFSEFCQLMVNKGQAVNIDDELRSVFKIFDKDQDGFISSEDLKKVADTVQWGSDRPPSDDDISHMIRVFDSRGIVDFDMFRRIIKGEQ